MSRGICTGKLPTLYDGQNFYPPPLGFTGSQVRETRLDVSPFTRGYAIFRCETDGFIVSVFVGLGALPTDSRGYVRNLTTTIRDGGSGDLLGGTLLEGNPLATHGVLKSPNSIRQRYLDDITMSYLKMADLVNQAVLCALVLHAHLDGCSIDSKKALEFFGDGRIDHFLKDLFLTDPDTALRRCDPNSLDRVTNLDFEIGLGITDCDAMYLAVEAGKEKVLGHFYDLKLDRDRSTNMHRMLEAFGERPWIDDPEVLTSLCREMFTSPMVYSGGSSGNRFQYCHPGNDYLEGEPLVLDRKKLKPPIVFRAALRGHDTWCEGNRNANKFRSHGAILHAPEVPALKGLDDSQRLAWDDYIVHNNGNPSHGFG